MGNGTNEEGRFRGHEERSSSGSVPSEPISAAAVRSRPTATAEDGVIAEVEGAVSPMACKDSMTSDGRVRRALAESPSPPNAAGVEGAWSRETNIGLSLSRALARLP
jgi:hypothetical protein